MHVGQSNGRDPLTLNVLPGIKSILKDTISVLKALKVRSPASREQDYPFRSNVRARGSRLFSREYLRKFDIDSERSATRLLVLVGSRWLISYK